MTTGRLPRSPPRRRARVVDIHPVRPDAWTSRSSVRSLGSGTAGPDSSTARRSVMGPLPALNRVLPALGEPTSLGACRDDVVRSTGDRRDDRFRRGLVRLELGGVAP